MTTTEPTTTETTAARAANGIAWLVTLVITAGLVAVVVIFAFSQNNTPASVDGRTATTSQFIDE